LRIAFEVVPLITHGGSACLTAVEGCEDA
jgi:hypothetical protein